MIHLKHEDCLNFFSEILSVLSSTNQHEEVFHLVVDRIVRVFDCQTCAVVIVDPATEYLHIEIGHGLSHTFTKEFRRKLATGPIGKLLWAGTPIVITDSVSNPLLTQEVQLENRFGSCLCVPVIVDHRTLGYLYADHKLKSALSGEDLKIFSCFASLAGIALNKSRMFEDNLRLDTIDHETEIEKYAPFLGRLNASMERAQKFGERFALMLMDVDNYKQLAQTYGYETSRLLLKELAGLLKVHLREIDGAGRYGFDEIILLRANSSLEEAVIRADELRALVEGTVFTAKQIKTTVSVGVSAFPENAGSIAELLTTVKNALFEAQRSGRNRVFHFHSEQFHHDVVA
ncbi:MAG TPA: diguanylate cyclase [Bacteroidota bacterium]